MKQTTQQRASIVIGGVMVFAMVASVLLPLFTPNAVNPGETILPTPTAAPTLPPPIADLESIQFSETFLHQSGVFTGAVPTGWEVLNQVATSTEAQVTLRNAEQLSVIEQRIIDPEISVASAADLNNIFDDTWLRASWREYTSWEENTRTVAGDRLVINFTLRRGQQEFIARQIATTDGDWVYVTRVVTPPNASQMLQYLLEGQASALRANKDFLGQPLDWVAYLDDQDDYFVRYPNTWVISDAAPGAPATLNGEGVILRVEAVPTAIASEDDARTFVQDLRGGMSVQSVEAYEKDGMAGYRVSYQLTTPDGDAQSGLAVLLNGTDNQLRLANLRLDTAGLDLLSEDLPETALIPVQVLQSFTMLDS